VSAKKSHDKPYKLWQVSTGENTVNPKALCGVWQCTILLEISISLFCKKKTKPCTLCYSTSSPWWVGYKMRSRSKTLARSASLDAFPLLAVASFARGSWLQRVSSTRGGHGHSRGWPRSRRLAPASLPHFGSPLLLDEAMSSPVLCLLQRLEGTIRDAVRPQPRRSHVRALHPDGRRLCDGGPNMALWFFLLFPFLVKSLGFRLLEFVLVYYVWRFMKNFT
jgi:hypothetical protein